MSEVKPLNPDKVREFSNLTNHNLEVLRKAHNKTVDRLTKVEKQVKKNKNDRNLLLVLVIALTVQGYLNNKDILELKTKLEKMEYDAAFEKELEETKEEE